MRSSRWLLAGLGINIAFALLGCTESAQLTLAELERHKRDVDKQMRLVREQNEQINTKLNVLKAEMDTIKTVYIPAVHVALESVSVKPEQARVQMLFEVENRLRGISDRVKDFSESMNESNELYTKSLTDTLRTHLTQFDNRIDYAEDFVKFVLTAQDSVNREFAVRIDKRPWYKSIIGDWDDRQRQANNP